MILVDDKGRALSSAKGGFLFAVKSTIMALVSGTSLFFVDDKGRRLVAQKEAGDGEV